MIEKPNISSIKLSTLEKAVKQIKKEIAPKKDCELSFEFIVASFFPTIMENIKAAFTQNYVEGYKAAKEEYNIED